MVMIPVVRFTSLRSTPGSFRVTRSTDALHAAQCIPEMSYTSSRIGGSSFEIKNCFSDRFSKTQLSYFVRIIYPPWVFVK